MEGARENREASKEKDDNRSHEKQLGPELEHCWFTIYPKAEWGIWKCLSNEIDMPGTVPSTLGIVLLNYFNNPQGRYHYYHKGSYFTVEAAKAQRS